MQPRRIALLGSTGSIGLSTCEVVRRLGGRVEIVALAAGANVELLAAQALEFRPRLVAIADPTKEAALRSRLADASKLGGSVGRLVLSPADIEVVAGPESLCRAAACEGADMVVSAVVGAAGILPTVEAIRAGKNVALANKEVLVAAGPAVMDLVRERGVSLIPVDSEHSAIFQCLDGNDRGSLRRIILTASGGPFVDVAPDELRRVTVEQALAHPNWNMGAKVTIDSATMMNKGLEVIEAMWLFGLHPEQIDVVVHRQSIVHSMVEYVDGAILAQLSEPDMKGPIQYALTWPERVERPVEPFDFARRRDLTFEPPDLERFPCLALAYDAARASGTMPAVLNAANEIAVGQFLGGEIGFTEIPERIRRAMAAHTVIETPGIDDVLRVDAAVRKELQTVA
ncbi:MAG: 1-deoxy-D-xylulose-5-phosphate reductoisomerase [Verrucomicrobia bacterium]|nr:1-deoxy-D-xylulose-5-phosphate reductoisomerase [Verrucomicrobiota bacterium]